MLTIASLLMPVLSIYIGEKGAFAGRFVMGISETMLIPSINSMVTKWIPINEKSLAASVFTAGNQLSGMFGNILVAELCASSFGWSSIFYSASLFGISWLVLWHLTVRNSPHNTRWIHKRELDYLANNIPPKHPSSVVKKTPWRDMLTSKVFWSLMFNSVMGNMMIALIFVYIPVYFKDVLMLDVQSVRYFVLKLVHVNYETFRTDSTQPFLTSPILLQNSFGDTSWTKWDIRKYSPHQQLWNCLNLLQWWEFQFLASSSDIWIVPHHSTHLFCWVVSSKNYIFGIQIFNSSCICILRAVDFWFLHIAPVNCAISYRNTHQSCNCYRYDFVFYWIKEHNYAYNFENSCFFIYLKMQYF